MEIRREYNERKYETFAGINARHCYKLDVILPLDLHGREYEECGVSQHVVRSKGMSSLIKCHLHHNSQET